MIFSSFVKLRVAHSARAFGILLCCFAVGCQHKAPAGEAASEAPKVEGAPVKVEPAEEAAIQEWTELPGTTQPLPNHSARISVAVPGQVVALLKDAHGKPIAEGQFVEKSTVVVTLDDPLIRSQEQQAVIALKRADLDVKTQ